MICWIFAGRHQLKLWRQLCDARTLMQRRTRQRRARGGLSERKTKISLIPHGFSWSFHRSKYRMAPQWDHIRARFCLVLREPDIWMEFGAINLLYFKTMILKDHQEGQFGRTRVVKRKRGSPKRSPRHTRASSVSQHS